MSTSHARPPAQGSILPRHHVEIFTTAARLTDDGAHWLVPVHGWVYTPQQSRVRKGAMAALLKSRLGLSATEATAANFDRRANLLFADNNRGRRLRLAIAGHVFEMPPTAPNGHTRAEFQISARAVKAASRAGRLPIRVVLPDDDPRAFGGRALVVAPDGVSVISDIDDTVKVSHVTDRAGLMDATFFQDFAAVPGMAALYAGWARRGAAIHFVSSSPWHLYAPLREMLDGCGFPPATLDLKQIRLKDPSILDLFKDATKTKPPAIQALLDAYPRRRFVLVGDSGEHDPEVYAAFARKQPRRIAKILIRNVTAGEPDGARFAKAFAGLAPQMWQVFDEPGEIEWKPG